MLTPLLIGTGTRIVWRALEEERVSAPTTETLLRGAGEKEGNSGHRIFLGEKKMIQTLILCLGKKKVRKSRVIQESWELVPTKGGGELEKSLEKDGGEGGGKRKTHVFKDLSAPI